MKTFMKIALYIVLTFLLSACGGGGSAGTEASGTTEPIDTDTVVPETVEPTVNVNENIPIAKAGTDFSMMENTGGTLNATESSDLDGDNLSYTWTQKEGPTVVLTNQHLSKITFIAPEVDAETMLIFEVEVSDGSKSSKDQIEVKILNVSMIESRHEVFPVNNSILVTSKSVTLPYTYNIYPKNQTTTGLILKIYWDSTKLNFSEIKNPYLESYVGIGQIENDDLDVDKNSNTDKSLSVSWFDLEKNIWSTPDLPLQLFSPTFTVKDSVVSGSNTQVNVHSAFDSPEVNFYSKTVLIEF